MALSRGEKRLDPSLSSESGVVGVQARLPREAIDALRQGGAGELRFVEGGARVQVAGQTYFLEDVPLGDGPQEAYRGSVEGEGSLRRECRVVRKLARAAGETGPEALERLKQAEKARSQVPQRPQEPAAEGRGGVGWEEVDASESSQGEAGAGAEELEGGSGVERDAGKAFLGTEVEGPSGVEGPLGTEGEMDAALSEYAERYFDTKHLALRAERESGWKAPVARLSRRLSSLRHLIVTSQAP